MRLRLSFVLVFIIFLLGLFFYAGRRSVSLPATLTKIDTITICDTIRDTIPNEIIRYVLRVDTARLIVHTTDTQYVTVDVPIELKEYATDEYKLQIEGFRPRLLYIETYNKTTYINKTEIFKTKSRWGLGVQAGAGYDFNKNVTLYIGLGIQYNIISW